MVKLSNRKQQIYATSLRFCQRNFFYPKTECMTTDILNSGAVDDAFITYVEEKEKKLFEVINEFREIRVW